MLDRHREDEIGNDLPTENKSSRMKHEKKRERERRGKKKRKTFISIDCSRNGKTVYQSSVLSYGRVNKSIYVGRPRWWQSSDSSLSGRHALSALFSLNQVERWLEKQTNLRSITVAVFTERYQHLFKEMFSVSSRDSILTWTFVNDAWNSITKFDHEYRIRTEGKANEKENSNRSREYHIIGIWTLKMRLV